MSVYAVLAPASAYKDSSVQDEDIFRGIVASYERKQEVLKEENKSLRQSILTIRKTVARAFPDSKVNKKKGKHGPEALLWPLED